MSEIRPSYNYDQLLEQVDGQMLHNSFRLKTTPAARPEVRIPQYVFMHFEIAVSKHYTKTADCYY